MKKRKIILLSALSVLFGAALVGAGSLSELSAEAKACGNSVEIGYYMDFNQCSPYSTGWENDCYAWDYVTVTPDMRYLGVGQQNVSSSGSGYIEYLVVAKGGRTIDELSLKMSARVFHLQAHDGCDCHMTVSAGDVSGEAGEVITYSPVTDGSLQAYTVNLTEQAKNKTECLVRIELSGLQWDWVGISNLEFVGSYNAAENEILFTYEEDVDDFSVANLGDKVPLVKAVAADKNKTYEYTATVQAPDGTVIPCDSGEFSADQFGLYTVTYTVEEGGQVCGESSYTVFVVMNKAADAYADDSLKKATNYYSDYGSLVSSESGLTVVGQGVYVLPFTFTKLLKFVWEFSSTNESAYARFALLAEPKVADFSKMRDAGFYFTFYNQSGGLRFNAYYTDGEKLVMLGDQPSGFSSSSIGKHAIELRKSTAASPYDQGAELYVDGVRFSDWLCYSEVILTETFKEGNVYFSYDVQSGAAATVVKAVAEDSSFPIIKSSDGSTMPRSGVVGDAIAIPDYYAEDDVDGLRPVTVTVTDPYSGNVELDENNQFIPQYEGTYRVVITSTDLSGNTAERRSSIIVSLKSGMCTFRFTTSVETNARVGKTYTLSVPEVSNLESGGELKITVTDPDGQEVELVDHAFVPEKTGTYRLTYSAENSLGTSFKTYSVYSKLDVDEKESYENFTNADYWVGEGYEKSEEGIRVWASSYLTLPFDLTNGIEITLKPETLLNKNETDCWFSVGIINFADYGSYSSQNRYGLYFMLFKESGVYKYNVLSYGGQSVVQTIVSDCTIGAASDIDEIVLRVEKYTGDASFDNNIVIYVNNTKNENYSVYNVAMSDMTDNENFTYLCFDSYSSNTSTSHKEQTCFLLTDISFSDYTAPVATLSSSLPKTAAIGDTILLPTVTITDNVDGTLTGKIRLYAPDGSTVDISSGSFTVTMEGRYQFIVKASDSSGNSLIEIYSLKVGDVSPVKEYTLSVQAETRSSGCQSSASGAPCLIVLAAVCLIKIKKQRKSKS